MAVFVIGIVVDVLGHVAVEDLQSGGIVIPPLTNFVVLDVAEFGVLGSTSFGFDCSRAFKKRRMAMLPW